jgi:FkbH-like protein
MGEPGQVEMIKLVIWDLDDTFWRGTLAEEGEVWVPEEHVQALKELTGRGIVNSICSKNHHDAAREVLERHGVWDLFVFPRIAFVPKGEAVKRLIADMGLRAANVLFVDDNATNLAEVEFYNPGIRVLDALELAALLDLPGAEGKPDPEYQRLGHYRLLEERHRAQAVASSNEDFLRASGLRVELTPTRMQDVERIHDMVMRTNQLNFTKKRVTRDEVAALLADPAGRSATVRVQDNFGDYGIVGWFYLRGGELEHFLFSCRTINLGIEQHVYAHLGHPRLDKVGETAAEVSVDDRLRDYITLEERAAVAAGEERVASTALVADEDRLSVFVLSACDLFQAVGRLALPMVDLTFECNTFRGNQRGVNTGTDYVRSTVEMGPEDKAFCREHFLNYQGSTAFATEIFARPYDYVVLGLHDDLTYGQYRHKTRRDLVVQLDLQLRATLREQAERMEFSPLIDCDVESADGSAGGAEPGAAWVAEEFEDEGLITPERFCENLAWILERLHPGTQLLVATAPELAFYREDCPDLPDVRERALLLNRAVRDFCAAQPRAHVIEMNDVVFERSHVTDYVMHLTAERGHALAQLILDQMAAHPSGVRNRRERLGVGDREVVLWDPQPERAAMVARVLSAAGMAPAATVAPGWVAETTPGLASTSTLNRRQNSFVVGVREDGDGWLEPMLALYGHEPGRDFGLVRPWVFAPDWKE